LALITVIEMEQKAEVDLETQRFRSLIIATHPSDAKKLLDVLDGQDAQDDSLLYAPALSDEEMDNYERLSHDEVEATIADLRRLGLAVG